MFLALLWAQCYLLLFYISPDAYSINGMILSDYITASTAKEENVIAVYYSFVTITTLGYGDILPLSAGARMLAVTEALTGQIYLVVLVARLVGLHIAHGNKPEA